MKIKPLKPAISMQIKPALKRCKLISHYNYRSSYKHIARMSMQAKPLAISDAKCIYLIPSTKD